MAKYYRVVALKENHYTEYKYRKQEYLIKLDFDTINDDNNFILLEKYNPFYVYRMDMLYKGMLRDFSIALCDKKNVKEDIYDKIFDCLETYIVNVLPIKIELIKDKSEELGRILAEYDKYERAIIGKLDYRDGIRKKMAMLGISRILFTHSLPLVAAEECYERLIQKGREFLVEENNEVKRNGVFELLVELMEDYHMKLLSTKVYWEKPEEKESYRKFWAKYEGLEKSKEDEDAYKRAKQVLFLKYDLAKLDKEQENISKLYKARLVEWGEMRQLPNKYTTRKGNLIGKSKNNLFRCPGK